MNELAAAQQQDQPNLDAARHLVQQKGFSLAKSTEGIVHLVHHPEAPEVTRQMILLPEPYQKQAILALHNATHAGAKATTQMARACYFWKGMDKDIKGIIKTCDACQRSKTTCHERAKPGTYPLSRTRFKNIHLDLVGPVEQSSGGHKHLLTIIDRSTCFQVQCKFYNINHSCLQPVGERSGREVALRPQGYPQSNSTSNNPVGPEGAAQQ